MHTDRQTDRRTVTGTDALPGVLWGDVTGSRRREMAQSFSCQSDGVSAASWRTAGAETPVVAHPEDAEAERVLDVGYDTYIKEINFQTAHSNFSITGSTKYFMLWVEGFIVTSILNLSIYFV